MKPTELTGESRMERKKEATKQKIIAVALKLFKKPGFETTTMEQIAQKVDIAKGTLYNYYPVKEAILSDYFQRIFREKQEERTHYLERLPDTRSRLIFLFRELLEDVQTQKELYEKYLAYRLQNMATPRREEAGQNGIASLLAAVMEDGRQNGEVRQDLPDGLAEELLEFTFIQVIKQYYLNPETFLPADAIEQGVDLFLNGVKQKPRRKPRKPPAGKRQPQILELVWNPEPDGKSKE